MWNKLNCRMIHVVALMKIRAGASKKTNNPSEIHMKLWNPYTNTMVFYLRPIIYAVVMSNPIPPYWNYINWYKATAYVESTWLNSAMHHNICTYLQKKIKTHNISFFDVQSSKAIHGNKDKNQEILIGLIWINANYEQIFAYPTCLGNYHQYSLYYNFLPIYFSIVSELSFWWTFPHAFPSYFINL